MALACLEEGIGGCFATGLVDGSKHSGGQGFYLKAVLTDTTETAAPISGGS